MARVADAVKSPLFNHGIARTSLKKTRSLSLRETCNADYFAPGLPPVTWRRKYETGMRSTIDRML